jgi:hypothetical protein
MRAVLALVLTCCTKSAPPAPVLSASAISIAAPGSGAAVELSKPDFGPRGPIVVTGYPAPIGTGMDDFADQAGFTSDGAKMGYCLRYGGLGQLDCVTRDSAGKETVETDVVDHPEKAPSPLDAKKTAAIEKWMATSGMPKVTPIKGTHQVEPSPLKGDWAFARDIELRVTTGAGALDKSGNATSQPFAKIGGVLKGEEPVWVVVSTAPHRKSGGLGEIPYHFTVVNALQLSPDGNELGVVTHSYCMEYCDDFEIVRMTTGAFAGRVYNDTGFRHHQKGDYTKSAELFSLATFADPSSDLYPYNLACAYARLGDPKAKPALALAIARGGDKIKTRAKSDADFASVKSEAWFADLTK